MRISDWSSDVCSSDLVQRQPLGFADFADAGDHVIFCITNVVLVFPTYSPLWQGPEYIFTIGAHMNTYSEAVARVQYPEKCTADADGVGSRVMVHLAESLLEWFRYRVLLTDRHFLAGMALSGPCDFEGLVLRL